MRLQLQLQLQEKPRQEKSGGHGMALLSKQSSELQAVASDCDALRALISQEQWQQSADVKRLRQLQSDKEVYQKEISNLRERLAMGQAESAQSPPSVSLPYQPPGAAALQVQVDQLKLQLAERERRHEDEREELRVMLERKVSVEIELEDLRSLKSSATETERE